MTVTVVITTGSRPYEFLTLRQILNFNSKGGSKPVILKQLLRSLHCARDAGLEDGFERKRVGVGRLGKC